MKHTTYLAHIKLFDTLLIFSLSLFGCNPAPSQRTAQSPCPIGEPASTDYIFRDKNRCEGVKQTTSISSSVELISLATRNISSYGDTITLAVPRIGEEKPQVAVQERGKSYRLDNFSLSDQQSQYTFNWSSYVLKTAKIPTETLRAIASVNQGSQLVYVPVILGQASGKYEIVLSTSMRAKFPTFQILDSSGKPVYSSPRPNFRQGEVVFTWDGRNAPAGRYELYIISELEQLDKPPEQEEQRFTFEHNPDWLR